MPVTRASAKNPTTRTSETRFEIVIVKRSLDAANAIMAGNSKSLIASVIICSRSMGIGQAGRIDPRAPSYDAASCCSVSAAWIFCDPSKRLVKKDRARRGFPRAGACRETLPARGRRSPSLLQRSLHRRERRVEVRAEALHHRDNGNGDTRSNQAVFDGRRTRVVAEEAKQCRHLQFSLVRAPA